MLLVWGAYLCGTDMATIKGHSIEMRRQAAGRSWYVRPETKQLTGLFGYDHSQTSGICALNPEVGI